MNCFITFHIYYIDKAWGSLDRFYKPLMDQSVPFLPRLTLKLHTNYNERSFWQHLQAPYGSYRIQFLLRLTLKLQIKSTILGTLSATEMDWCQLWRYIHCCWSLSYPTLWMRMMWGDFCSIYMPLIVVHTVSFQLRLTLILHPIYLISVSLPVIIMGWCTAQRDIHCCWWFCYIT